jgi:hypothetical protein
MTVSPYEIENKTLVFKANMKTCIRFEVFTAVTMKNVVFWDVALCRSWVNRCFIALLVLT